MTIARVKYVGATPGADTNIYTIFSTALSEAPPGFLAMSDTHKILVSISASNNGTLKAYKAITRDINNVPVWQQVSTESVTVTPGTDVVRDYLVEPYLDWKLEWTNGGSAQTTWMVDVALSDFR